MSLSDLASYVGYTSGKEVGLNRCMHIRLELETFKVGDDWVCGLTLARAQQVNIYAMKQGVE